MCTTNVAFYVTFFAPSHVLACGFSANLCQLNRLYRSREVSSDELSTGTGDRPCGNWNTPHRKKVNPLHTALLRLRLRPSLRQPRTRRCLLTFQRQNQPSSKQLDLTDYAPSLVQIGLWRDSGSPSRVVFIGSMVKSSPIIFYALR
jgi:hypothetical protein